MSGPTFTEEGVQRRIIGYSGFRLDGLSDLLLRARDASVLDIGCNRGMVGFEFALCGASAVHGCDNYERGIMVANEVFADHRRVDALHVVCDLTGGAQAMISAFGKKYLPKYDFVLFLATYHKLRRLMTEDKLVDLVDHLLDRCGKYFVMRGADDEIAAVDIRAGTRGFEKIHYSRICEVKLPEFKQHVAQPAAVWALTSALVMKENL